MNTLNITIESFSISSEKKGLTGTCVVDYKFEDGTSVEYNLGSNKFDMHACISDDGVIESRCDNNDEDEIGNIWNAIAKLSKETLLNEVNG